jgi:hypothetical protein
LTESFPRRRQLWMIDKKKKELRLLFCRNPSQLERMQTHLIRRQVRMNGKVFLFFPFFFFNSLHHLVVTAVISFFYSLNH